MVLETLLMVYMTPHLKELIGMLNCLCACLCHCHSFNPSLCRLSSFLLSYVTGIYPNKASFMLL